MTALTVDLQDLGCHVRVRQRHMLHAAGVGDAIVPSVHMELEAAPHWEWFSRGVHLLGACRVRKWTGVHYTRGLLILLGNSSGFCARSSCKKILLKKKQRKTEQFARTLTKTWETFYFKMLLFWHRQLQCCCCCCCFSLHLLWGRASLAFESQVKVEWIVRGEQCEHWLGWLGVFAPPGPSLKHPSQHKQTHPAVRSGFP